MTKGWTMILSVSDNGVGQAPRRGSTENARTLAPFALDELVASGLVLDAEWEALPHEAQAEIVTAPDGRAQLALLRRHGLLTDYQAMRLETGNTFGLVLGNYRVLECLGSGGMGVVFRAEHLLLRRPVAIKVLHATHAQDPRLLQRFHHEVRAVARLQHPNVVAALDAGSVHSADGHSLTLHYFVMEFVPGENLEQLVTAHGAMPVAQSCDVAFQIAEALAEADKHHLIHRDIKPSNIQLTPGGQAKLLDFGLARLMCDRVTAPGTILGSLAYMAPEQALDASTVDIRADLYALGATLVWCLFGEPPFPRSDSIASSLAQRQRQLPPALMAERPDIPPGLRLVLRRMLAIRPEDRYPTPQAVMDALVPFLKPDLRDDVRPRSGLHAAPRPHADVTTRGPRVHQVLIVDDDPDVRELCRSLLKSETVECDEAHDGVAAMEAVSGKRYDLLLLDIDMPRMTGREVLRRLRETPPCPHLKIILFSGRASGDDMAELLLAGADDYLPKPFSVVQLQARVKTALRFKDAQDRSDLLNLHLLTTNRELEQSLSSRDMNLIQIRNGLVLALAKLVEYRDSETGQHLIRMQRYCECLAEEAAKSPPFDEQIDPHFIEVLVGCVPLHDIGKAIVPDHILLKPGKLDATERLIVQRHTLIGRDTLASLTLQQGLPPAFLQMAIDIACHHHERFDGQGYPDQLAGTDIPLSARIVSVADVYDALRSRRVYKPALSHATAFQVITKASEGQFDPNLLTAFGRCAHRFDDIFREFPD
jgi:response regulator RpfG family c-di-GMP phosphodiesterase